MIFLNYLIDDRDSVTGQPLTTGICKPCLDGYYPNWDLSTCLPCPDPTGMIANYTYGFASNSTTSSSICQCKSSMGFTTSPLGGTCVNAAALNTAMAAYGSSSGPVTLTVILAQST